MGAGCDISRDKSASSSVLAWKNGKVFRRVAFERENFHRINHRHLRSFGDGGTERIELFSPRINHYFTAVIDDCADDSMSGRCRIDEGAEAYPLNDSAKNDFTRLHT